MEDHKTVDHLMDLIPILAAHGVTGAELQAAALEAQRQTVIYASVWAAGSYGAHNAQKARARASVRKMFPGTVLRDSWDRVDAELVAAREAGRTYVFASQHLMGRGLGPSWWYDSRNYPGAEEASEWPGPLQRARKGSVDDEGRRYDESGSWYVVDMAAHKRANGYEGLTNARVFRDTPMYVEGLDVQGPMPGETLPDWWDADCQHEADRLGAGYHDHHPRNPRRRTAALNIAAHRGFMI